MSKIKPLARKNDIVIQEFGDEILIYDLRANKAFNLNKTSTLIWQLSDGGKTVAEIADALALKFNSPINEEFVWLGLERLQRENLIEKEREINGFFDGVSRREIIRKIGLGSLVAFPVVAFIVAPTAVHAQSCTTAPSGRPLGCPCTAISQCVGTPVSTRCCSNVPGDPRICVVANTLRTDGQSCGNNCDCISNNCVDPVGPVTGTCQP